MIHEFLQVTPYGNTLKITRLSNNVPVDKDAISDTIAKFYGCTNMKLGTQQDHESWTHSETVKFLF